ncbi:PAS domain S-box-containing protein [Klenkia soli]|uniref:PAS domain S-box-containing protein n=1 Tax=Klenkia soli TaxID=1052260 RepID=A0A1H0R0I7_9ACTN|nr:SpoIIE family protein phosphatase [Klenkia soli]SDP23034.1 PAS domain S-box-containing protein [Klenkia soli]
MTALVQELAAEAAGIGSFDLDLASGRLVWDDRLVEMFGYERGSFGETLADFTDRLHPDDVGRVGDAIQQTIDTVGALDVEYRVQRPDGTTRWVVGRGRAIADETGRTARILGVAYDTTGQRDAEARVSRVLESMSAAFFSLDADWRFSYVNAEAERVLGRGRDELLGGVMWELFPHALGSDFEMHYRSAVETGQPVVFDAYYPPPLDAWFEVRAWPGPDGLSVYFLDVTQRRRAQEQLVRSAARLAMIAEVTAGFGAMLAGDLTPGSALAQLARAVVPVLGDTATTTPGEAPEGAVAFPLVARDREVGVLWVHRGPGRPPMDADDLAAGREVADRAALALDSVRLYEQQRRIAEELQLSLLTAPPATPGALVAVRYLPAAEAAQVGGDWYDAFRQPDGGTMVVIGDVVGHDTEAAAAMGQLRGLLRGIAHRAGWGPAAVLADLDRAMTGLQVDTMGTAAIARLEPGGGPGGTRVRWSNAGHPPIMVLRADGTVQELATARADLMLGVDDRSPRTEHELLVAPGSTVLLYTDGLVESREMPLDDGLPRLAALLAELGPVAPGRAALEAFCDEVVGRLRPAGSEDDVALVALRLD